MITILILLIFVIFLEQSKASVQMITIYSYVLQIWIVELILISAKTSVMEIKLQSYSKISHVMLLEQCKASVLQSLDKIHYKYVTLHVQMDNAFNLKENALLGKQDCVVILMLEFVNLACKPAKQMDFMEIV